MRTNTLRWAAVTVLLVVGAVMLLASPGHSQDAGEHSRKITQRVDPQYPQVARNMNISGAVRIEVTINPNGTVKSTQVKGGHPLLAQSAQIAVSKWKWEPGAHESTEVIEVRFHP